jgi:hypothetical protein
MTKDVPEWLVRLAYEEIVKLNRTTMPALRETLVDGVRADLPEQPEDAVDRCIADIQGNVLALVTDDLRDAGLVLYQDEGVLQATPAALRAHELLTGDSDPA